MTAPTDKATQHPDLPNLVDLELAGQRPTLSDRQEAHDAAHRPTPGPAHCVAPIRKALGDRRVSIRPAPDTDAATDTDTAGLGSVPAGTSIDIQLVMTDRTLFDGDNEPAHLTGHCPIPDPLARHLLRTANPTITPWEGHSHLEARLLRHLRRAG